MKDVTVVITSCNRHDLLKRTLNSFSEYNTYPVTATIIIEDSAAERPAWLTSQNYPALGNITWISNGKSKGQIYSIDRAYSEVKTEYIFHCEDDWEFIRSMFIEESLSLLVNNSNYWTVNLRGNDCNGHPVIDGILEPYWYGGWGGLTFNPGLRRLSDYKKLGSYGRYMGYGTHGYRAELALSRKQLDDGFRIASLPHQYVEHTGTGRSRAADDLLAPVIPKVLIAIPACHKYAYADQADGRIHKDGVTQARVQAIRNTWLKYLPAFASYVDVKFFYGNPPPGVTFITQPDEVTLNVNDDYKSLPHKVKAIYAYALEHGYDFVFKGDDDTFIYIDRLLASGFEDHDYIGYVTNDPKCPVENRYASGGSGYWLSRKAMKLLVAAPIGNEWAEDRWVGGVLFAHGIRAERDARYLPGFWEHFVNVDAMGDDHSYITMHACTPDMMQKLYSKTLAPNFAPIIRALHEDDVITATYHVRRNAGNPEIEGIPNDKPLKYAKDTLTVDWWDTHDRV